MPWRSKLGWAPARLLTVLPPERRQAGVAYILIWMIAASASILVIIGFAKSHRPIPVTELVLFLGITTAADALVLHLHHGRSKEFVSLLETAICMNILLFPPPIAFAITLCGSLVSNVLHRRHPVKILFNLSQYAVATAIAVGVFELLSAERDHGWRMVLALIAAMASFGIVNSVAIAGLVAIWEQRNFKETLFDTRLISTLTVLGNTALGILAAAMWRSEPGLTVLFLAPAAILHLAYRGVVKTNELLEAVESERAQLDRIVVGASDGIALVDAGGTIDVWNPAMTALTGIDEREACGAPLSSVLVGTTMDGNPIDLLAAMAEATPEERTSTTEMMIARRGGDMRVVKIRHTVLFDPNGNCAGDAMMVHDITREHENERLKDDFLARVSHELRTPLTPIKGYAQMLLRRSGKVPEELRNEALTSIAERVDHMEALVDDLLLVSRIVAGRASLTDQIRPQSVDVTELCSNEIRSFATAEPEREISLEIMKPIPTIVADPARIHQILRNLLSNACKYAEDGSPVKVLVRRDGGFVAVEVVDRGRGISSDQLNKVFERFFRSDDPLTMTTGGAGLGLHISQELARAMHGDVTVESTLGQGSTFTLRLPVEGDPRPIPGPG